MKGFRIYSLFVIFISMTTIAQTISVNQVFSIRNAYEARREEGIGLLRGKPLVKEKVMPPVFSDGSNFSRDYSYSLLDYAFKCFWLNEDIESANKALLENTNYYIGYPRAYSDKDSFYWGADELCKMLEFYGSKGSIKPGLIQRKVEERIYLMMYQYSKQQSKVAKADYSKSKTWYIDESENHHIQRFYVAWHFAKFLMKDPLYKTKAYDDGFNAACHYKAWNSFAKEWVRERGRKGLFIEMANDGYGLETLKGVYNLYDFGDKELSVLSKNLLDLYWAAWAQEQIDGVRGGAKCRVYPSAAWNGNTTFRNLAWYYLGINTVNAPHGNLFTLVTSKYRMPIEVMYLALNKEERGAYEINQRRLGLAEKGFFFPPDYHVLDSEGLIRYSYCTPEFIAGSFFCKALPYEDWVMISSQNRWAGVIFSGDENARIYAQCMPLKDNRAYNQYWCVQHKGSMVFQKLDSLVSSRGARDMEFFISKAGLSDLLVCDNCVFVESKGAYAAIRCINTSFRIKEVQNGTWIIPKDVYSPIILEVDLKENYKNYEDFQNKVRVMQCTISNEQFNYHSLSGSILTMDLRRRNLPSINGTPINLTPVMGMDSPFLQTKYNSGIVTIRSNKKLILDFNK